jgi:uncharacterized protein (DUF3084 family)
MWSITKKHWITTKVFQPLYKKQMSQKAEMLEDSVSGLQTQVDASNTEIAQKNSDLKKQETAIDSLTTEQLQSQLSIKDLELTNTTQNELELTIGRKPTQHCFCLVLALVSLWALSL